MKLTNCSSRLVSMVRVAGLIAMSTSLQAQAPPRAATPAPEMVLVGCLRSGSNPSGVPSNVTYTLEPIETAPPAGGAELTRPKTGTRYTLTADSGVEFSSRVGQKVEITGHLKDLSADKPAESKPAEAKQPPQPGGAHNTFEVATLKVVAAKCP